MYKISSILIAAALFSSSAPAEMPSKKDLAEVQPIVLELMDPLLKDYENKTKTAADVGDGAVEYAKEAKSVAAKYTLLTGAIEYYVRGRKYDKAADTIDAICELVPDIPGEDLARITSGATRGTREKQAPRLFALNKMAKAKAAAEKKLATVEKKLEAKPDDAALLRSAAELTAATGDWEEALGKFARLGGATGKMAQDELDGTARNYKLAGFWWDYKPAEKSAADAITRHAATLYKAAVDGCEAEGLMKVLAEKRIAAAANLAAAPERNRQSKYKFNYRIDDNGNAWLCRTKDNDPCVIPKPEGVLVIPEKIDGRKVAGFDEGALGECNKMTRLVLPKSINRISLWTLANCQALERIDVSPHNPEFTSIDGVLYSKDKKDLIAYPQTRKEIMLVPECRTIGWGACISCPFVNAKLPDGIEFVGAHAFDGCRELETVDFPKTFKIFAGRGSLGWIYFKDCPKLRIVRFHGDAPRVPVNPKRLATFLTCSPDEVTIEVERGSKGWNGAGSKTLPERWPYESDNSHPIGAVHSRPIRYIK